MARQDIDQQVAWAKAMIQKYNESIRALNQRIAKRPQRGLQRGRGGRRTKTVGGGSASTLGTDYQPAASRSKPTITEIVSPLYNPTFLPIPVATGIIGSPTPGSGVAAAIRGIRDTREAFEPASSSRSSSSQNRPALSGAGYCARGRPRTGRVIQPNNRNEGRRGARCRPSMTIWYHGSSITAGTAQFWPTSVTVGDPSRKRSSLYSLSKQPVD